MNTSTSPETLLVKSFDLLIESRASLLPFKKEASLIADFTRLYIQNLFDLNENQFQQIMKQHCGLHVKASKNERMGKNPYLVLEQQILKKDTLGKILERYAKHLGSLDCILDVKATAALVHHLVSLRPADNLPTKVTGCELGSGTGVLSIAGSIPFMHNGNILKIHAFEQSLEPRQDAAKVFSILKNDSKYRDKLEINFQEEDITSSRPYQIIREAETDSGPLVLWISETFGYQSKKPVILKGESVCSFSAPTGVTPYSHAQEKTYDPLPQVLDLSCQYIDGFLSKIASREIVAFPDIVRPQVVIDGTQSVILSPDGVWRKLHEIGQPYDMLPTCVNSRWAFEETPSQTPKKRSQKKPLKNKKKRKYFCR